VRRLGENVFPFCFQMLTETLASRDFDKQCHFVIIYGHRYIHRNRMGIFGEKMFPKWKHNGNAFFPILFPTKTYRHTFLPTFYGF
jgi:hypothetical protein